MRKPRRGSWMPPLRRSSTCSPPSRRSHTTAHSFRATSITRYFPGRSCSHARHRPAEVALEGGADLCGGLAVEEDAGEGAFDGPVGEGGAEDGVRGAHLRQLLQRGAEVGVLREVLLEQ